jgi:hypothetical protein
MIKMGRHVIIAIKVLLTLGVSYHKTMNHTHIKQWCNEVGEDVELIIIKLIYKNHVVNNGLIDWM